MEQVHGMTAGAAAAHSAAVLERMAAAVASTAGWIARKLFDDAGMSERLNEARDGALDKMALYGSRWG